MAARETFFPFQDFRGGVSARNFPTLIQDNESVLLQNADYSTDPAILQTRLGRVLFADDLSGGGYKIKNFAQYFSSNPGLSPSPKQLFLWTGGSGLPYKLYRFYSGVTTWQSYVTSDLYFAGDEEISSIQMKDSIYWGQAGSGIIENYNGTNNLISQPIDTNPLLFPSCHIFAIAFGRIFAAGNDVAMTGAGYTTPKPGYIWFSDVNLPEVWDRVNWAVALQEGTGLTIMGLKSIRNQELIVFTNRSCARLIPAGDVFVSGNFGFTSTPQFQAVTIDENIGCGSKKAIASVGTDIIFMDQKGNVRSLARTSLDANQGAENIPISDPIQPYIDRINKNYLRKCSLQFFDRILRFSVPLDGNTEPSATFHYDMTLRTWSGPHTYSAQSWIISDIEGTERLYAADPSTTIKVYRQDEGYDDAGSAIPYVEETKRYHFGAPHLLKRGINLKLELSASEASNVTTEASVDGRVYTTLKTTEGSTTLDTAGTPITLPQTLPFRLGGARIVRGNYPMQQLLKFYDLQLRFSHSSTGKQIRKLKHTIEVDYEEPRERD